MIPGNELFTPKNIAERVYRSFGVHENADSIPESDPIYQMATIATQKAKVPYFLDIFLIKDIREGNFPELISANDPQFRSNEFAPRTIYEVSPIQNSRAEIQAED